MKLFSRFVFSVLLLSLILPVTVLSREPQPERTDWFLKHGYGVFVHYLNGIQNNPEQIASLGKSTSWDECVNEFNVELFAERMKEIGAGYVIFTIMQMQPYMIAPNETFNRLTGYKTGEACSSRDLIEDLYQALHKRNIDLMLYFTGDGVYTAQGEQGLKRTFPVNEEFVRNWSSVAAEYGNRYKDKVKGWWVDGTYATIGYNDNLLKIFAENLRVGNPDRIIAFNNGNHCGTNAYSIHEDYTAGEQNSFTLLPWKGRFVNGEQWHLLSPLGLPLSDRHKWENWGTPGIAKDKQEMAEYVHDVNALGGVISFDVVLYRNGDLDRSQIEILKSLRERIAKLKQEGRKISIENLAWKKPASLRSNNDKQRELIPSGVNGGDHNSLRGVDGKMDTASVAGYEYAWTYEVDLMDNYKIRQVNVHFGSGYPTDVEVFGVEPSGKEISLGHFTNQKGESIKIKVEPTKIHKIRVRSYKPDGPNQTGGQMSVAELEVYE
jgi:hypothetical protein